MRVGIGLPNPIPGLTGETLVEWARRAEQRGFSAFGTIGRVAYPSYDELIALSAAAAVTERVELISNVLLGATRNPVLLAKEAASLDQISGGRFVLGLGAGARQDDFAASGTSFRDRGRRLDRALEVMHRAWNDEPVEGAAKPVTPRPTRDARVPILIGGTSDRAVKRAVEWGIGWTAGGGGPDRAAAVIERVRKAWSEAGKEGEPRIVCLEYFALGAEAEERGGRYLSDYYGDFGPMITAAMPKSTEDIRDRMKRFEDIGTETLIFDPTIAELDQVEMLAEAVF
ncbi:MAG TPA: LLM class flavin-dependent oxidoreductase [Actinomycetota bacterium]|nr:LLM class flavin-dependent oxidoreductase [Actinomycetota bacterium]